MGLLDPLSASIRAQKKHTDDVDVKLLWFEHVQGRNYSLSSPQQSWCLSPNRKLWVAFQRLGKGLRGGQFYIYWTLTTWQATYCIFHIHFLIYFLEWPYEVGVMLFNQPLPKHSGLIQQPFIIFHESAGQFWCGPGLGDLAGFVHASLVGWWVNCCWPALAGLGCLNSSALLLVFLDLLQVTLGLFLWQYSSGRGPRKKMETCMLLSYRPKQVILPTCKLRSETISKGNGFRETWTNGAISALHLLQKASLLPPPVEEEMEASGTASLGRWLLPGISLLCSFLVIYCMGRGCFQSAAFPLLYHYLACIWNFM